MEDLTYTPIGPVLHLNKAGELAQKRMKAAKLCDGLYITEPDKSGYTQFICELNGVVWLDCKAAESRIADGVKLIPGYFDKIKAGAFDGENIQAFKREISRRINRPDAPAIMELKKPERKKPAPLPEGAKKVGVIMFKGCTDEMTDKIVIINEVAPHVYTYTYKLKGYGERVKIIFEIDGVYFQGADNGVHIMAREDFNEICVKAYEHARENVADGAAKGMRYFVEVQKRIDAATPPEVAQTADTDAAITLPSKDINYMFYIKPKGAKRFSTYNPGKGTMNTGRVFTELYRKEHLPAVCKWIAEDMSGDFAYQLRSGDGKRIYWEHNPTAATSTEMLQIPTETAADNNVPTYKEQSAQTTINAETRQYIISAYKTKENLTAKFSDAIESIVMQLEEYRANKRKGGRMRKENIRRLEEQIKLLYAQLNEWSALFDAPQSPETPQTIKHTTHANKPRETARKEPKRTIRISLIVHNLAWRGQFVHYHFAHVSKMTPVSILSPPGYVPPIRGDCLIIGR